MRSSVFVFEENVQAYEVMFDYEDTSAGPLQKKPFPITALVFEGEAIAGYGKQSLDFVLLKIGPDQTGKRATSLNSSRCH
jgi:hypothetical protein